MLDSSSSSPLSPSHIGSPADSGSNGPLTRHPTEDPENHGDGFDEENHPTHPPHISGTSDTGGTKPLLEKDMRPPLENIAAFYPVLQAGFQKMNDAIAAENWKRKGGFPPPIEPPLAQVAISFNLMPSLFPYNYNKFTMSKQIKRTADEGFPKAAEDWGKSIAAWDSRKKRLKPHHHGEDSGSNSPPDTRQRIQRIMEMDLMRRTTRHILRKFPVPVTQV
ncbi:hypothetical protein FB446DRAFT_826605 [Lentinula raphanica]|nr:hypothetical protein FB446DRAFT_826605 [Lentinula raphanica]